MLIHNNLPIVLFFQSLGEWLTTPMKSFTFLGQEEFFLLFMPFLYWCLDVRLGLRMGVILMLSNGVNAILKVGFHSPRPYWQSTQVRALVSESSFGMPSGHAMNAASLWGLLAASQRRRWLWILLLLIILLIGLSRVYLGVHFFEDVLMGWAIGFLLLWAFLRLGKPFSNWLAKQTLTAQVLVSLGATLLMIAVGAGTKAMLAGWQVPSAWVENATRAAPQAGPINPLSLSGLITSASALFGLACGAFWLSKRRGFNVGGTWGKRILRFPLGLVGVLVIWFGLGAIFPHGDDLIAHALRFIRYSLIGFWISALAPMLFIRLGLATTQRNEHPR